MTASTGLYYFFQLRYHPLLILILFILPVLVINFFLYKYFIRRLKNIFNSRSIYLKFDVIILTFILLVLSFLLFDFIFYIIIFSFWILLQIYFKKKDLFLIAYAGMILFSAVFFSRIFLVLEERSFFIARVYLNTLRHRGEEVSWSSKNSIVTIFRRGNPYLQIKIPENMYFHGTEEKSPGFENPEPGIPVGFISSSETSLEQAPYVWIFETEKGNTDINSFQGDFKMFLGYRKGTGEIKNIIFEGSKHLELGGVNFEGFFWIYSDNKGSKRRSGMYMIERETENIVLILQDIPVEAFPHHPRILQLLNGIRF